MEIFYLIVCVVFGILIGSFLNVCIYRIPKNENIVVVNSHCMTCGKQIKWYDLVPLISFLMLGGKCRYCKTKLSLQYPVVEAANGLLYGIIVFVNGFNIESILYCLCSSALLALSVIDWRTFEIPDRINVFIAVLGVLTVILDFDHWAVHVIGMFAVSVFLLIVYLVTAGAGIGGGDIKLSAVCGLFLGYKLVLLGFFAACITV